MVSSSSTRRVTTWLVDLDFAGFRVIAFRHFQQHFCKVPQSPHRLGFDDERSRTVLTESDRFVRPGPRVRPVDSETGYHGPLPPALFEEVKRRFVELARSQRHKATIRSD